jgi:hypothetical protein
MILSGILTNCHAYGVYPDFMAILVGIMKGSEDGSMDLGV